MTDPESFSHCLTLQDFLRDPMHEKNVMQIKAIAGGTVCVLLGTLLVVYTVLIHSLL